MPAAAEKRGADRNTNLSSRGMTSEAPFAALIAVFICVGVAIFVALRKKPRA